MLEIDLTNRCDAAAAAAPGREESIAVARSDLLISSPLCLAGPLSVVNPWSRLSLVAGQL